MMVYIAAALTQPEPAAKQFALAIGCRAVGTHIAFARYAPHTLAAGGKECEHDAIADREQSVVGITQFFDRRHGFMPECHRHGTRTVAVDDR